MCCILCFFKPKCFKILLFIVSILLLVRNQLYLYLGMLSCSYLHSCSTKGKRNHWNCRRNKRAGAEGRNPNGDFQVLEWFDHFMKWKIHFSEGVMAFLDWALWGLWAGASWCSWAGSSWWSWVRSPF